MDEGWITLILKEMKQKTNDELYDILDKYNHDEWTEEAFEAIRRILIKRNVITPDIQKERRNIELSQINSIELLEQSQIAEYCVYSRNLVKEIIQAGKISLEIMYHKYNAIFESESKEITPPKGAEYLKILVRVKNCGNDQKALLPSCSDFKIVYKNQLSLDNLGKYLSNNPYIGNRDVYPGIEEGGWLAFEVSNNWKLNDIFLSFYKKMEFSSVGCFWKLRYYK